MKRFRLLQKTVAEHAFDDCFNMGIYIGSVPSLKLEGEAFTCLCLAGFSTAYALGESDPSYLPTADNLVGYGLYAKLAKARDEYYELQGQVCRESDNPITVNFFIRHASEWLGIPYHSQLWTTFEWPKPFGYLYDHFEKARPTIKSLYLESRSQCLYEVFQLPGTYFRALAGCLALQIYMECTPAEDWSTKVADVGCADALAQVFTEYSGFIDKFESMAANTPGAKPFLVK